MRCYRQVIGMSWALLLMLCGGAAGAEYVDDLGKKLTLKTAPMRVISLAPNNTELLYALGLGDRVVGVTEFCNYPPEAADKEKVAGFNTINLEKIAAAEPDLVLAMRGNDMESVRSLRELGIPVFSLDIQTLDQVVSSLVRLGQLFAVEKRADELGKSLVERMENVQKKIAKVEKKPSVMWGFWSDPVYTAGAGTMIDDLFTRAGGVNVGRRAEGAWPQVSLETIILWAPEVIVTTYIPGGREKLDSELERLRNTDGWQQVPAVRDGRVYYVEADWLLRPSPRLIKAYEVVARYLHPQVFVEE